METVAPAFSKPVRTPWEEFPEVILHSSIWKLKSLPEYQAAKRGNAQAAQAVVQQLLKSAQVNLNVDFVVPVVQIDRGHFNAIPVAFGALLAKALDAQLWLGISQVNKVNHTASLAIEQILQQPVFGGVAPKGTLLAIMYYGPQCRCKEAPFLQTAEHLSPSFAKNPCTVFASQQLLQQPLFLGGSKARSRGWRPYLVLAPIFAPLCAVTDFNSPRQHQKVLGDAGQMVLSCSYN